MALPALMVMTGTLGSELLTETTERANRSLGIAGLVNNEFCSGLHLAQISECHRIGHPIPFGNGVALQIGEAVTSRFGFEQVIVGRHGVTSENWNLAQFADDFTRGVGAGSAGEAIAGVSSRAAKK